MDNGDIRFGEGQGMQGTIKDDRTDLKARAGDVVSHAVDEAKRIGSTTRERFLRGADEKKRTLADRLDEYARKVEEKGTVGGDEGGIERQLMDTAAQTMRSVSRTLSGRSTEEMIDLAGRKIRERPGLFLAGCVALGFIGARILRR
jgi:vacuolar-type H+-ATPase subunit E/Vma4